MRLVPLLASFALTASVFAQTPAASPAVVLQNPASQGCPVGLEARHAGEGSTVRVSPSEKHPGQGYVIRFSGHTITQARITLHGLSGQHVIPAGEQAGADSTESFNVSPAAGKTTVYTGKLTGVQWVQVNEITYPDGTQWHESADAVCRVAPNGFLLVASGK